uniref:Uncharacterized protein n=1 Tax=Arundo donax TaxID=35708 RepID=A0A0A8ZEB0_ARUDO
MDMAIIFLMKELLKLHCFQAQG